MLIILFLVLHFNFLFVPCGRLSWLPVSFLLHVKHTLSDQFRTAQSSNSMESAEHEPITGVWGGAPSGSPGGKAPGGGSGELSPPEAECFFCFCVSKRSCKFAPLLIFAKVSKSHSEWTSHRRISNEFTCCHVDHIHLQLPLNSDKYLTCAPAQVVVFHLLHTDRMQL